MFKIIVLSIIKHMAPQPICTNVCRYTFAEDGSLHIHSTQVTDTGRYLCMATNPAGTQQKRVDLQVYGAWCRKSRYCLYRNYLTRKH